MSAQNGAGGREPDPTDSERWLAMVLVGIAIAILVGIVVADCLPWLLTACRRGT
jgi:hypothetical protein